MSVDVSYSSKIVSQNDEAALSAFGVLETAELTPVIQGDFVYGLNTQVWSTPATTGTGATVDTSSGRLRIQSGTSSTSYAYVQSRKSIRYRAGQGTVFRFTPIFTAGVANNVQLFGVGNIASNAITDGYFYGYNGTSFGIAHYIAGTPTWIPQTSWNGDKCNGSAGSSFTLNPAYGTPMMIKYPYLGFGDIVFFIQNPLTARWVVAHVIRYANTTATLQLTNPTLRIVGFTANSGNTGNITLYCGSVGAFISGMRSFVGNPKWSWDNSKGSITTETNILTLKNCTTYNGAANRGLMKMLGLSYGSSAATGSAAVRLKINATLDGTPSYTTINGTSADAGVTITSGNSIASYDTAGTTVSGGTYIFGVALDNPNSTFVDLSPYEIFIAPTETMTISGFSTNSSTIAIGIHWSEDI